MKSCNDVGEVGLRCNDVGLYRQAQTHDDGHHEQFGVHRMMHFPNKKEIISSLLDAILPFGKDLQ